MSRAAEPRMTFVNLSLSWFKPDLPPWSMRLLWARERCKVPMQDTEFKQVKRKSTTSRFKDRGDDQCIGRRGVRFDESRRCRESFRCTIDQRGSAAGRQIAFIRTQAHWNWPERDPVG